MERHLQWEFESLFIPVDQTETSNAPSSQGLLDQFLLGKPENADKALVCCKATTSLPILANKIG